MKNDLYKHLKAAVIEGLSLIKGIYDSEMEAGRSWVFKKHEDYPTMSYYESGFPRFSKSNFEKINFSSFLKDDVIKSNPCFRTYAEYVLSNIQLCNHFRIGESAPETRKTKERAMQSWNDSYTYHHICYFCDSYIHFYSFEFDEFNFEHMFNMYLFSLASEVEIDIYIPILLVDFESDEIQLAENLCIQKIPIDVQLSRNQQTSYTNSAHTAVVGAANYAIVLKNWTMNSETEDSRTASLHDIEGYREALSAAEQVFTALRIVYPKIDTGYAQVLSVPTNWQSSFNADIIQTFVASEKSYPAYFENYGWEKKSETVASSMDDSIKSCYEKLLISPNLDLASSRLNKACLNRRHDDAIIDIAIALESILTTDSTAEISYRLATRAALLVKQQPFLNYTASQVFALCKKIYDFRSSVVHGDKKRQLARRKIEIIAGESIETNEIAIQFLSHILKIVSANKALVDPKGIDNLLFSE
jgi:hypothetical protein